ncbi:hypothetical protein Tco_0265829 [Tanacetum coccineum]
MMMVVCYDDGEDGGGGSGVVEVARGASGVVDRVDRSDGESFGLRRKNPPEKFSGGSAFDGRGVQAGAGSLGREVLRSPYSARFPDSALLEKLSGMSFHIELL